MKQWTGLIHFMDQLVAQIITTHFMDQVAKIMRLLKLLLNHFMMMQKLWLDQIIMLWMQILMDLIFMRLIFMVLKVLLIFIFKVLLMVMVLVLYFMIQPFLFPKLVLLCEVR